MRFLGKGRGITTLPLTGLPNATADSKIDLDALGGPRFVVTIDTEEEFDWNSPFTRDQHGTEHVAAISRFQRLCESNGVKPCYLVDYPITESQEAVDLLGGFAAEGGAEIGMQLHPWVNPPFDEETSLYNSYPCNLPAEMEREKLTRLYHNIVGKLGVRPDCYRAGRYGAGAQTPMILRDLGVSIDTSVRTHFTYTDTYGPDYRSYPETPYWLLRGELMEIPVTTTFAGLLRSAGRSWFQWLESATARSLLARSGMVERIALTPEGIPVEKAIECIDLVLDDGLPILNLSFHSPSLAPGFTPYVRCEAELEAFYRWWHAVFDHLGRRHVRPATMAEIMAVAINNMVPEKAV